MATATAYTPFNADTFTLWSGTATIATSTHIQVVNGFQIQNYFGFGFTFDLSGNITGGTLTSTNYILNGVIQYEGTGLSHSMVTLNGFLQANDPQGVLGFVLNGNDTFIGSTGNDVANGYTGSDSLLGGEGNDIARGGEGNDALDGGLGDDTLDGGTGIDTAVFSGNRSSYAIGSAGASASGPDGTDTLANLERLQFSDSGLAFDLGLDQSAGRTVRIIGAAFDTPFIIPQFVGIGLDLFDGGMTTLDACALVIGTGLFRSLTGTPSNEFFVNNEAFVNLVFENVVGVAPTDAQRALFVGMLQGSGGPLSQAELLVIAAEHPLNAINIDLVGLEQSGVEFV